MLKYLLSQINLDDIWDVSTFIGLPAEPGINHLLFSHSFSFFPFCLLKVLVHKIFRRSSSEDDIAYTVAPVQGYCATETDILPPEKSKLVMGLSYCTRSIIRLIVWAWSHLGHWAECKEQSNTRNRAGGFCKVIQRNVIFQGGKQKYEYSACVWDSPDPFLSLAVFFPVEKTTLA